MTHYACPNPGCPKREPVTAPAAPTCYTCARPMREVAPGPVFMLEPYIYEADFFSCNQPVPFHDENRNEAATPRAYHANDAQISFNGIPISGVLEGPFVELPEPTPEPRAAHTLPPITIEVTPTAPSDVEAFLRDLQAEILRALTTIDRVPHDQPVTFRVREPSR